jgi:hypothetical protein
MHISYDSTGKILAAGQADQITTGNILVVPSVPVDFLQTFSLGKYIVVGEELTEVEGWEPPEPPSLPL